ncbi:hypothetical protein MML48_1g12307 [Holotrichia oblita]|uniref:Uncharacterized protein n=1 Tax=Holotrichia oblita TaxID=644536 RepID=A0ACB9TSR0_HOLOL|nr:hypothetical protein MML48_1g12307 [Holotrichia oblita]
MPRQYTRKVGAAPRATWSEEALKQAVCEVESQVMSINAASKHFGIPSRTLRRRMLKKDSIKRGLEKVSVLGYDVEKELVLHIKKLEKLGFPCTRTDVRKLAFQLAQKLNIKHNFDVVSEMGGKQWLQNFLERHEILRVRQADGSCARALGFTREEIGKFFKLYEEIKLVLHILLAEKVTLFRLLRVVSLPPVLIIKGVNLKPEFLDGLPPGSAVYMNKKFAYVNSGLFMKCLEEHFIPRKPLGKVLLLFDGHGSHCNDIQMLETAASQDVILLGLPGHTTHGLQPLDRSFLKPFKTFYATELRQWIVVNKERKITRYQAGKLIRAAWIRATSTINALSDTSHVSFENTATINMPDNNLSVASYEDNTDNQSLTHDKGSTSISIERASSTD